MGRTDKSDGFQVQDLPQLRAHLSKCFGVSVTEREVATNGWSWGEWTVDEDGGEFRLCTSPDKGSSILMEVPVAELAQVINVAKQDLSLEFQPPQDLSAGDEVLHEMRLFFPGAHGSNGVSAEQAKSELLQRANLSVTGESIIRVPNVMVAAPRGKHSLEFFPQEVKLHGQSRSYVLKFSNIDRLFLCTLPPNEVALVVALSTPLLPSQQPFLVFQFPKDVDISIAELSDEQRKRYNLPEEHTVMPVNTLVARLFKELSSKAVLAPSTEFQESLKGVGSSSSEGMSCLRCSYKSQPGFIFPLKKSFVFVTKPVMWVHYRNIERFVFGVSLTRGKTFDLRVTENGVDHDFSQLDRSALSPLYAFLQQTGAPIANADEVTRQLAGRRSVKEGAAPVADAADEQGDDYNDDLDEDFPDESSADEEESSDEDDEEEAPRKSKRPRKA